MNVMTHSRWLRLGALGACIGVAACGGSTSADTSSALTPNADGATGGATGSQPNYGDPPAQSTRSLDGLLSMVSLCSVETGEILDWTDPSGEARNACLIVPSSASATHPLPLVVYLHPSLVSASDSSPLTGLIPATESADLTGDPTRKGYVLLMPSGRDTRHYYPFPDNEGVGWDNWYRNLDRSSPALNVDVATIDHFIAATKDLGVVDPKRVYLSGWSNGASMAELYALNTPGIGAAAVYSAPAPFSDVDDPGAQTPFASNLTPIMDIHNQCDIIGTCQTAKAFHKKLESLFPTLVQRPVIIDDLLEEEESCTSWCSSNKAVSLSAPGALNHLRWPLTWNEDMFTFMREHPSP